MDKGVNLRAEFERGELTAGEEGVVGGAREAEAGGEEEDEQEELHWARRRRPEWFAGEFGRDGGLEVVGMDGAARAYLEEEEDKVLDLAALDDRTAGGASADLVGAVAPSDRRWETGSNKAGGRRS
jgi:hypothetical protein